jgi:hypothetical protein
MAILGAVFLGLSVTAFANAVFGVVVPMPDITPVGETDAERLLRTSSRGLGAVQPVQIAIDGKTIGSVWGFQVALFGALNWPEPESWTLDDLERSLIGDVAHPVELTWRDAQLSRQYLGPELFAQLVGDLDAIAARIERLRGARRFSFHLD